MNYFVAVVPFCTLAHILVNEQITHQVYLWLFTTIIFIPKTTFQEIFFKLFIPLEFKYNKL